MTQLENMNDVQFLAKKNAEITKLKLIQAGLILVIIALAVTISVIAILSRISQPAPEPKVDVIQRATFCDGKYSVHIPEGFKDCDKKPTITAGEPFVYNTTGKKLVANGANVKFQLVCELKGNEQLTSLGEVYSNIPAGDYNLKRTYTIPINSRIMSSDNCTFQSIATYTFYQADQAGTERSFDVMEVGRSNPFKLVVPEDAEPTATTQSTNNVPQPVQQQNVAVVPQSSTTAQPASDPIDTTNQPEGNGSTGGSSNGIISQTLQPTTTFLDNTLDPLLKLPNTKVVH